MKVRIKYFADITRLKKEPKGDMIDLRCAEAVQLKEGEYYAIPLGVAMELPTDYGHMYILEVQRLRILELYLLIQLV